MAIRFKRALHYDGSLTDAINSIKNNGLLVPGEPLIASYKEDDKTKYLLAIGTSGQDVTFVPSFESIEALKEFIKTSAGIKVDDISEDSDIYVQKSGNKISFKLKDTTIKRDVNTLKTNLTEVQTTLDKLDTTVENFIWNSNDYTIWFSDENSSPTLSNYPASDWEDGFEKHLNDLYCIPLGKIWKFKAYNGTYRWEEITDVYTNTALEIANGVKESVDNILVETEQGIILNKPIIKGVFSGNIVKHYTDSIEECMNRLESGEYIIIPEYYNSYFKYLGDEDITIKFPLYYGGNLYNSYNTDIDFYRALVGTSFLLYNRSNSNIAIKHFPYNSTSKIADVTNEETINCEANHFVKCECTLDIGENGREVIYWNIIKGQLWNM